MILIRHLSRRIIVSILKSILLKLKSFFHISAKMNGTSLKIYTLTGP